MKSRVKIKKGQIEDYISDSTQEILNELDGNTNTRVRTIQVPKKKLSSHDEEGVVEYLNSNGFVKLKEETIIFHVVDYLDPIITILVPSENEVITDMPLEVSFEINIDTIMFNSVESENDSIELDFYIE